MEIICVAVVYDKREHGYKFKWSLEPLTSVLSNILMHCEPDPNSLFLNNKKQFIDDLRKRYRGNSVALGLLQCEKDAENHLLSEVQDALARIGYLELNQFELQEPENIVFSLPEIHGVCAWSEEEFKEDLKEA